MANGHDEQQAAPPLHANCPIAASEKRGQPIGTMNGKWAFLLKAVLITTPAAWAIFVTVDLPWRIWVTKNTFETQDHQAAQDRLAGKLDKYITTREQDYRTLENRIDNLPPAEWRARIMALENWERENRTDHADIKIALEAIKAKLDIPPGNGSQGGTRLPLHQETRNETATAAHRGGDGPGDGSNRDG